MTRRRILFFTVVIIVAAAVGGVIAYTALQPSYKPAIELPGNEKLKDFTLIDQYGREFSISSVKGKVALLYFGYTNCPDICPLVMSKFAYLEEKLGDDIDRVAMILITTDPERDTPDALRRYVERYSSRIIALTGTPQQIEEVLKLYGIYSEKSLEEGGEYLISHFALVIVADKNMVMRYALTPEMEPDEYVRAVRYLLEGGG